MNSYSQPKLKNRSSDGNATTHVAPKIIADQIGFGSNFTSEPMPRIIAAKNIATKMDINLRESSQSSSFLRNSLFSIVFKFFIVRHFVSIVEPLPVLYCNGFTS